MSVEPGSIHCVTVPVMEDKRFKVDVILGYGWSYMVEDVPYVEVRAVQLRITNLKTGTVETRPLP